LKGEAAMTKDELLEILQKEGDITNLDELAEKVLEEAHKQGMSIPYSESEDLEAGPVFIPIF
jgi:hypothetical protein